MKASVHAGFEGLVWLVIVIIAIASELVKAARRDRNWPRKPADGNWGLPAEPDARTLDERITEHLKQLRKVHPAPPPAAEPVPPRLPPALPRRPPPAMMPPRRQPAPHPRPAVAMAPSPPAAVALAPRIEPSAEDARLRALRETLRTNLSGAGSLRQVVLLAEIIGPPRAMRPL